LAGEMGVFLTAAKMLWVAYEKTPIFPQRTKNSAKKRHSAKYAECFFSETQFS